MVPIVASVAVAVLTTGGAGRSVDLTPIRLIVVAPAATMQSFVRDTLEEAKAIWRPLGVEIVWLRADVRARAQSEDGPQTYGQRPEGRVEVAVTLEEGPTRSPDGVATLGWIRFAGPDVPAPDIHLSPANAEDLMMRTASLREARAIQHDVLLARALGRALAHELGHYLLKSRTHGGTGLMRAIRPSVDFFSPSRAGFHLTADERAALAAHLACADGGTRG